MTSMIPWSHDSIILQQSPCWCVFQYRSHDPTDSNSLHQWSKGNAFLIPTLPGQYVRVLDLCAAPGSKAWRSRVFPIFSISFMAKQRIVMRQVSWLFGCTTAGKPSGQCWWKFGSHKELVNGNMISSFLQGLQYLYKHASRFRHSWLAVQWLLGNHSLPLQQTIVPDFWTWFKDV